MVALFPALLLLLLALGAGGAAHQRPHAPSSYTDALQQRRGAPAAPAASAVFLVGASEAPPPARQRRRRTTLAAQTTPADNNTPPPPLPLEPWVSDALDFAARQLASTVRDLVGPGGAPPPPAVPRSAQPGVGLRMEEVVSPKGALGWTTGFFPGSLWLLYEYLSTYAAEAPAEEAGARAMLEAARAFTDLMAPVQRVTNDHDVGFVAFCSYGQGLRVLRAEEQARQQQQRRAAGAAAASSRAADVAAYRAALLRTADALAARFDPRVGATLSWDWWGKKGRDYPVIVDNLMNMELLFWAGDELGGGGGDGARAKRLRRVAEAHVRTTLRNHFRDDAGGTAWHLVNYDPRTGAVRRRQNYQGYDDDSLWARGQGWALYGHSFAFRETRDRLFLRRAVRLAQFLYSHPNMPSDGVPYWDLADPRIPDVPRDASAGAIYASALYELSRHVRGDEGEGAWDGRGRASGGGGGKSSNGTTAVFPMPPAGTEAAADARWASLSPQQREAAGDGLRARLRGLADRTLRSLADAGGQYRETVVGANGGFVLKHSVGSLNERLMLEIDVPVSYADYYFIEALLRREKTRAELERHRREPRGGSPPPTQREERVRGPLGQRERPWRMRRR